MREIGFSEFFKKKITSFRFLFDSRSTLSMKKIHAFLIKHVELYEQNSAKSNF